VTRSERFGLDTSVVLRLIVGEPESLALRAAQFVDEAARTGAHLVASNLVVCETYFALHAHYGVPKRKALAVLVQMLTDGPVRAEAGSPIVEVLQAALGGVQKPGFVDRLIHAEYLAGDAGMVSFEQAARRLPRTRIL
jgi:predicted nucleic-acid-binding protein